MASSSAQSNSHALRKQASAGARWTATAALANTLIKVAQLAILGRLLTPSDFGLMAMMMVVIEGVNLFSDLGVSNFLVQTPSLSRQLFLRLLALCAVAATLLAAALSFSSQLVAAYYHTPALADLLPSLGIVIVATAFGSPFNALLERAMRFRTIAMIETAAAFCGFLMAIGLALEQRGVWALMAGQVTFTVLKAALCVLSAESPAPSTERASWSRLRAALRFGQYEIGARSLNLAAWSIDKLVIGRVFGDAALGAYSAAYQLVLRPFSILGPIFSRVTLPLFSKIQDDDERLTRGYLQTVRTIAVVVFPIYVSLIIASDSVVFVLLGPQWGDAAQLVSILGGLGIVFALANPIGTLLLAKGRPELPFFYNGIAVVVYALAIGFGSHYGIYGVAWGFVLAAACLLWPLEFWVRWHLVRMLPMTYLRAIAHPALGGLVPLAIIKGAIVLYLPAWERIGLDVLCAAAAVAAYFAYLWWTERSLLHQTLQLMRKE